MPKQEIISGELMEGICKVIADTQFGLTGTEIGKLLADSKIKDVSPDLTKWKRLYNAFDSWQYKHQCSNNIWDFILKAMNPVRYVSDKNIFQIRRTELNQRLCFIGLMLTEEGKITKTESVSTI